MSAIETLKETGKVDVKERLEKIKSKGYWRVNIRPIKFEERGIGSLPQCWKIMEDCKVSLRGWDYPVLNKSEKIFGKDWVQSGWYDNWTEMAELWRFYQSGQFIHYFSCMEDYREIPNFSTLEIPRGLSVTSTLYKVTEIYELAARLAEKNVLQDQLKISIKLLGMRDRALFEWDGSMIPVYKSEGKEILVESQLSILSLLGSSHEEAINKTMDILSEFMGYRIPRTIIEAKQQRLLEKRLG
jgi:hypothetical protein